MTDNVEPATSIYKTDLYHRIRAEIESIAVLDTHEHLYFPHELEVMERIDFGMLFRHYTNSDLCSAGMPEDQIAQVWDMNSPLSPLEKWRLIKPWWERSWNTGYCEAIRIAMRDLYGIEELSDKTVEPLSEKMNAVNRTTWTREVFDKVGIDIALEQNLWTGVAYPKRPYPDLFLYDIGDPFTTLDMDGMSKDTGISIGSLTDYLNAIDYYFDKHAREASAYKISRAYDRSIFFADVPRAEAERIFNERIRFNDRSALSEIREFEDFIAHYCIAKCGEHGLPVKIHTGLQDGNVNDITNSRPNLLINLFMKYPHVNFDIYHISWPYSDELMAIAKQFPNVWVDFCWMWIINPPAGRRYLHEMLETLPVGKIHGFGGDFFFVEGSYGHCMIAKREIARVLAEKVVDERFTEEQAVSIARMILRDNALEHFRVEEKRRVIGDQ